MAVGGVAVGKTRICYLLGPLQGRSGIRVNVGIRYGSGGSQKNSARGRNFFQI